jgi:hypothetical protein
MYQAVLRINSGDHPTIKWIPYNPEDLRCDEGRSLLLQDEAGG